MSEPQAVITDPENTFSNPRDLALEAAACLAAIIDARREKTLENQRRNLEIKALEKRGLELVEEIRSGGGQLVIKFGSTVATTRALASTAPKTGTDDTPEADHDEPLPDDDGDESDDEDLSDPPEATH